MNEISKTFEELQEGEGRIKDWLANFFIRLNKGGDDSIWRYSLDQEDAQKIKLELSELIYLAEELESRLKEKPMLQLLNYLKGRVDSLVLGSMTDEKVKTKNAFDLIELALKVPFNI